MANESGWLPERYDATYVPQYQEGMYLLDKIALKGTERVLDVGSGTGRIAREIARRIPGGEVVGIDQSSEMVEYAVREARRSRLSNIRFTIGDLRVMAFDTQFDLVFSNYVLHWLDSRAAALAAIHQATCQGGHIALQIGAKGSFGPDTQAAHRVVERLGLSGNYANYLWPCHYPTQDEYLADLEQSGFTEIVIEESERTHWFKTAQEGIDFHLGGGFSSLLTRVPPERRASFLTELQLEFEKRSEAGGIPTLMRSLFVTARKE